MGFRTLISTAVLASHMDDPAYAIVDCRAKLDDLAWGAREHAASHLPGAVYADLTHDLSGPRNGSNGRHPLPDPETLAQTFSRLGIASGVQVVTYDQENGMFASRLWWLLRWLGHDAVAVLDGGFKKWTAERRPVESGEAHRTARAFAGSPRADMSVDVATVASRLGVAAARLVDARAPERYRGDSEPIDTVGGHIPGARSHFFQWNLDQQGLFRTPEELRAKIGASVGVVPADQIVCYCGSGVTACHNLLAFEHAGLSGAKLYAGSWSEWSSDPQRPVEKGSGIPYPAMSHTPVRAGNLPAPVGPYSPGMGFDKLIFVSGQGGTDPATGRIADNVEQQTEQCLKNVQTILDAAGSGLQHVLRCGVFLMDMGEFKKMNAAYARMFGDHRPARTTVQVAGLPGEGLRVEIDAIAYRP